MSLGEKLRGALHRWADGNWDGSQWRGDSEVDPDAVMGSREAMLAQMGDDAVEESENPKERGTE